jgi:CelD/BcsL family acetyltransferase involved in cellulose biosynthesis
VDGVKVVDYLSGDDGYKRLWMSEVRERRSLLAYKLRSARGLALAARASAAGLVKSVLPRRPAT